MIAALRFKVNGEYSASIYGVGTYNRIDWDNGQVCSLGDDYTVYGFKSSEDVGTLNVVTGLDGNDILRLIETRRYIIKIDSVNNTEIVLPSLRNGGNKSLKIERDENSVIFQFINYLGRSHISFSDFEGKRDLVFEVIPDKMDFEDDYIELTESLAEKCSEVLMEYSGSTSNLFTFSEDEHKTLLEQFVFLRQFCFSENIQSLFEAIKRNPDRILVDEEEIHPFGYGAPSKKVYKHPFQYGRNWNVYTEEDGRHYYLPSEVVVSKKRDNLDTAANRFLKFALEYFDSICESLINSLDQNGEQKQTECRIEAERIHGMINDILRDHFFDEVKNMDIIPQNNQVLQKREGYSQIFAAYAMIDLAMQLDWHGKDDVYEGESKNVALLYEYWLFFELCDVIGSIDGCVKQDAEDTPFVFSDAGKLTISLQEGKQSCQSFHIPALRSKVNLYYNRTFSPTEFRTTKYEGSYSRPFRPDYTLAIFPDHYKSSRSNGEKEAIKDGTVSYIHFDAKYRITDLTSFIGKTSTDQDEEKLEIEEEKTEEIINTYKRGDLLKMHTYNDAIRRTIGSYVLYPGSGNTADNVNKVFSLYDEILPGVGAFAIKPSNSSQSEAELKEFITNLIAEKAQNSSRLNRIKYYSEMILREPASAQTARSQYLNNQQKATGLSDKLCIVGYMRADTPADYFLFLRNNGKLRTGEEFYFYYYAIKDGSVYSHHADIAKAGHLRIYTNQIHKTGTYELEPLLCGVESNELISKTDLVNRLNSIGYMTKESQHHADYYYIMKVKVIDDSSLHKSLKISDVNSVFGNDSFSPHSPKVLSSKFVE